MTTTVLFLFSMDMFPLPLRGSPDAVYLLNINIFIYVL